MPQPNYSRFSHEERIILANRLSNGEKPIKIAAALGRPRCTIYREITRNSKPNKNKRTRVNKPSLAKLDARHFRGTIKAEEIKQAKIRYEQRKSKFKQSQAKYDVDYAEMQIKRRHISQTKALDSPLFVKTRKYVLQKLGERWSPEQIAGRLKLDGILPTISHTTIYKYIYSQTDENERKKLLRQLRRKGKPYRHEKQTVYNQTNRAKHSIHDRPSEVEELSRLGDLEGDTIVSNNQKDRILTHVCRVTGLLAMGRVLDYNANNVSEQTTKDIKRVFGDIKTITYDNGSEFSAWKLTEVATNSTIFFADPYTPRQRGCNENTNGLIRDYLPKGTDFRKLDETDIMFIEDSLNSRPRKRLGYLSPLEMFDLVR